jgi:hypothetical protein
MHLVTKFMDTLQGIFDVCRVPYTLAIHATVYLRYSRYPSVRVEKFKRDCCHEISVQDCSKQPSRRTIKEHKVIKEEVHEKAYSLRTDYDVF